jgi:hypothetical protein
MLLLTASRILDCGFRACRVLPCIVFFALLLVYAIFSTLFNKAVPDSEKVIENDSIDAFVSLTLGKPVSC